MANSKQMFLAVATGQNVANAPPIIEVGRPGDRVLWIESPRAAREKWAEGATRVLQKRGFEVLEPVRVRSVNDPRMLLHDCQNRLHEERRKVDRLAIVLNGGQKLTPVGLNALMNRFGGEKDVFLYGQDRPAELWEVSPVDYTITRRPYTHSLTLPEILACSGWRIQNPDAAFQAWSAAQGRLPLPDGMPEYPRSLEEIDRLHCLHFQRGRIRNFPFFRPDWDLRELFLGKSAVRRLDDELDRFIQATRGEGPIREMLPPLYNTLSNVLGYDRLAEQMTEIKANLYESKFQSWMDHLRAWRSRNEPQTELVDLKKKLYEIVANILREAIPGCLLARSRLDTPPPLGASFERAVIERVCEWVEVGDDAVRRAVTEIWGNVRVARPESDATHAEFDILMVLANGVLLHLECKSFNADLKDLDARLTTLHTASSNLAQMAVTAPVYTQLVDRPWMQTILHFKEKIERLRRIRFIPFTLPGQPEILEYPDGTRESIETFENYLQGWLDPYVPTSR